MELQGTSADKPDAAQSSFDALHLEFMQLPEADLTRLDVPLSTPVVVLMGLVDNYSHSGVTMQDSKQALRNTLANWYSHQQSCHHEPRIEAQHQTVHSDILSRQPATSAPALHKDGSVSAPEVALFASHDSFGVVDLGATKTVIGIVITFHH